MNAAHRRRALQIVAVGLALTLLTVILDRAHQLGQLENRLYDFRLAHCQHFGPPPTTQIVYLDLDDNSVPVIGFPVPRASMADMLREIYGAGAKGVFFDFIYSEPTNDKGKSTDRSQEAGPDDRNLAGVVKQAGDVMVPVSFHFQATPEKLPKLRSRMVRALEEDLEISSDQLVKRFEKDPELLAELAANPSEQQDLSEQIKNRFLSSREQAAYTRIDMAVGMGITEPAALRAKLFPHFDPRISNSIFGTLLEEQYMLVRKDRSLGRFTLPIPGNLNEPLLNAVIGDIPIPIMLNSANSSGYVEPLETGDGRIRSISLGVNYHGRMIPHASLAMTCEMLGVPISSLRWTETSVTIPLPTGREINIPVSTRYTDSFGKIPYVMDVPWFGNEQWETMYDYPNFVRRRQRYPLVNVFDVCRDKTAAEANQSNFLAILKDLLRDPNINFGYLADVLDKNPAPADIEKSASQFIDTAKTIVQSFEGITDLKPDEKALKDKYVKALQFVPEQLAKSKEAWAKYAEGQATLKRMLDGKAVFIGWTATGVLDFYPTSLHAKCPGVVIHGTVFNGIMTGRMWKRMPDAVTALFTVLLGVAVTIFVAALTPLRAAISTISLAAAYYLFNGYVAFDYGQRALGLAGPTVVIVLVSITLTIIRYRAAEAERNRLTKRFRSYVDPKLVNYVIENPDEVRLTGTVKEMSVVFTDLEGFTTLSEALKEKTVPMLSEYMGEMVPLIRSHNGYVNKFLGDGIMFFFNAPYPNADHAADAVSSVLDMQRAMGPFNEKLKSQGLPTLNMRVGIVSGDMVVGDAGPENASDYTVLGDNVNLASRLEGANKATGTNTMIHWKTKELLGDRFLCRPIGRLMVKGKTEGIMTFEPMGPTILADDRQKRIVECSEKIVNAYFAGEFDACIAACEEMDKELGPSKYTKLYRKEAEHRKEEFANDGEHAKAFAGVITLSEK